ncbi:MAG: alpha/beta fold hydrolase [Deltaproteobacteria bacterium]
MTRFLLVHGSGHGAWCWREVLPLLTSRGHQAKAIDLPGGDVTLDDYADFILAALEGPSVIVAHSMGGYPASAAALKDPSQIARIIYLTSYIPVHGKSLADRRREVVEQPLLPAFVKSSDGKDISFDPSMTRALLYHDCSDAQFAYAQSLLKPQPVLPQVTPLALNMGFEALPKSYIICDDDKAIPPLLQSQIASVLPAREIAHLPSSHSPFFSMPARLVEVILGLCAAEGARACA